MNEKQKIVLLLEAIAEKLGVNIAQVYSQPDPPGTKTASQPDPPGT
jgi:hypothetical protein